MPENPDEVNIFIRISILQILAVGSLDRDNITLCVSFDSWMFPHFLLTWTRMKLYALEYQLRIAYKKALTL